MISFDAATHTYWRDGFEEVPSVTRILADAGFGGDYGSVPPHVLEQAAKRGRAIHAAIEGFELHGQEPDLPVTWAPYWRSYLAWREADGASLVATELEHLVDCPYSGGYAGTLDLAGELDGATVVVDFKTRRQKPQRFDLWQLAAYAMALHGDSPPPARIVLHLHADGKPATPTWGESWDEEWGAFETCLRWWHLRKLYGKGGKP